MANQWYGKGLQHFGNAEVDWVDDTIRVYLVDLADYTVSINTHEFLSSVPEAARVAYVALSGKTNTLGVLDAADAVFTAVTGDVCEACITCKWTGDAATSYLLHYITEDDGGLPATPDGTDITVLWNASGVAIL